MSAPTGNLKVVAGAEDVSSQRTIARPSPVPGNREVASSYYRDVHSADLSSFSRAVLDRAALVMTIDPAGRVLSVNRRFSEVSGLSAKSMVGRHHRRLRLAGNDRRQLQALYRAASQSEPWQGELSYRGRGGLIRWAEVTIMAYRALNGRIHSYTVVAFDVTAHKAAELKLSRLIECERLGLHPAAGDLANGEPPPEAGARESGFGQLWSQTILLMTLFVAGVAFLAAWLIVTISEFGQP
jgi:PAS domain S-box-containing protein